MKVKSTGEYFEDQIENGQRLYSDDNKPHSSNQSS